MGRRLHVNELRRAIIAEAEVALRRANFQPQIEHIHRLVTVIERRMQRFEDQQAWWRLEKAVKASKAQSGPATAPLDAVYWRGGEEDGLRKGR